MINSWGSPAKICYLRGAADYLRFKGKKKKKIGAQRHAWREKKKKTEDMFHLPDAERARPFFIFCVSLQPLRQLVKIN